MARTISPAVAVQDLVRQGILPREASVVPRKGRAHWEGNGLRYQALVERSREGGVHWQLFVSDGTRLGLARDAGGLDATLCVRGVGDRRPGHGVSWPSGPRLEAADLDFFRQGIGAATAFVDGRADLCYLLMQETDVVRGGLYAWLYQGYPARLVQALLISRDMEDPDLEGEVREKLAAGHRWRVSPNLEEDLLAVARRRAQEFEKTLGMPISI